MKLKAVVLSIFLLSILAFGWMVYLHATFQLNEQARVEEELRHPKLWRPTPGVSPYYSPYLPGPNSRLPDISGAAEEKSQAEKIGILILLVGAAILIFRKRTMAVGSAARFCGNCGAAVSGTAFCAGCGACLRK